MTQGHQEATGEGAPPPRWQRRQESVAAPKRGSGLFKGCLIAVVVFGVLSALVLIGLFGLLLTGAMVAGKAARGGLRLEEVTIGGEVGAPKVACVPVEGVIHGASVPGGGLSPVALVSAQLQRAGRDPEVCGVLLYVDSPGGNITGSDILHREIERLREGEHGKPVVVCMMDLAASGAYYVSVAADKIIAHPTTVTGSIGVMMPLYDATGLMKKVGVRSESLTTGSYTEMGSPFVEQTEEQKRRERELLREIIQEMHARFINVVAEGRRLKPEQVRALADGRIFTSAQALEHGLIDGIGYEADAVQAVKQLAEVPEVHLVRYRRVVSFSDIVTAFARGPRLTFAVEGVFPRPEACRPMFLWSPPAADGEGRGAPPP